MAVTLIPNQRFIFYDPDQDCNTSDQERYCQLVAEGDDVYFQFKQTPCEGNIACNPLMNWGAELATDGDFLTNPTLSGWTLGTNWTWDNVNHRIRHTNGSIGTSTYSYALDNGAYYFLTFDVTFVIPAGSQSLIPSIGGTAGTAITADGTYSIYLAAGVADTVTFLANQFTDVAIDNVSLHKITCWSFSNSSLVLGTNQLCHTQGAATSITASGVVSDTNLYKIQVFVSNRTQGVLTVSIGANVSEDIISNGDQTVYLVADGSTLSINMDSYFDGCITIVFVYKLKQDFKVGLYDLNGNYIADLTGQSLIYYQDEYVTVRTDFVHGSLLDIDGVAVPYGCYKFGLVDTCVDYVCDPLFDGSTCGYYSSWHLTAEAVKADTGLNVTTVGALTKTVATQSISLEEGECYMVCYRIVRNDASSLKIAIGGFQHTFVSGEVLPITGCEQFTATGVSKIDIIVDTGSAGLNIIDYIHIYKCYNFLSNCLSWKAVHDCTKSFFGLSDKTTSLGFRFGVFRLDTRLRMLSITPSYDDEEENYLYSTGERKITYAQVEEYFTFLFDKVDRITHAHISALIKVDRFYIDGVDGYGLPDPIQWYVKKGGYTPDWDKDGRQKLVQGRLQAKIKGNTIFNSGCS